MDLIPFERGAEPGNLLTREADDVAIKDTLAGHFSGIMWRSDVHANVLSEARVLH